MVWRVNWRPLKQAPSGAGRYQFCLFNTPHLTSRLASIASSYISSSFSGGGGKMTADGTTRCQPFQSSWNKHISLSWYPVLKSQWIRTQIRDIWMHDIPLDPLIPLLQQENINHMLMWIFPYFSDPNVAHPNPPSFQCYILHLVSVWWGGLTSAFSCTTELS